MKVSITARNPSDNSVRYWGLGVDRVPRGNWLKDDAIIKSARHQGDPWIFDLLIEDGKHTLYFIVSQTDLDIPGYNGEALFGDAGFTIVGVDNDTINSFDIEVKNGVAKRVGSSTQPGVEDIPENTPSKIGAKFRGFGSKVKGIKNITSWEQDAWIQFGAATGGIIGAGVITYVVWKMKKKGSRF